MLRHLDTFERVITYSLLIMMAIVVLLATYELGYLLVKDAITPPLFLLEIHELLELFGMFLLVLIGIELLHSVKTYIVSRTIHLEAVFTVAMIAVARKVIVLEPKELSDGTLLGIAVLVFTLAVGYYLVRRSRREEISYDQPRDPDA